jgi:hypothetical protein
VSGAKLAVVKALVNNAAAMLVKAVPGTGAQRPVSRLTRRLFQMLRDAAGLAPGRFYQDKNWPRLLEALEKTLVFISEEDGHYAGQLAQAMLLIHDLVEETRRDFPRTAEGDVAWLQWASRHEVTKFKQAAKTKPHRKG